MLYVWNHRMATLHRNKQPDGRRPSRTGEASRYGGVIGMGDAFQCERCGDLYPGEPRATYDHDGQGLAYQTDPSEGDLCDECSQAVKAFIEAPDRFVEGKRVTLLLLGNLGDWDRFAILDEQDEPFNWADETAEYVKALHVPEVKVDEVLTDHNLDRADEIEHWTENPHIDGTP